ASSPPRHLITIPLDLSPGETGRSSRANRPTEGDHIPIDSFRKREPRTGDASLCGAELTLGSTACPAALSRRRRSRRRANAVRERRRVAAAHDVAVNACGAPQALACVHARQAAWERQLPDRKSTRLNSSHVKISYAVF